MRNRAAVSVEMAITPTHLVRKNTVNPKDEHLARKLFISLFLVLGRLKGVWPALLITDAAQTMNEGSRSSMH